MLEVSIVMRLLALSAEMEIFLLSVLSLLSLPSCRRPRETVVRVALEGDPAGREALERAIEENPRLRAPRAGDGYYVLLLEPDPGTAHLILRVEPDPKGHYHILLVEPDGREAEAQKYRELLEALQTRLQQGRAGGG